MYKITQSNENFDLVGSREKSKKYYLELRGNFKSKLPIPKLIKSPERKELLVLDFSTGPCGLKAYGAEQLIAGATTKMGYAAPRVGHASEAIAFLCELYKKQCVFFAPASYEVSAHQYVVTGYKGCELRFAKIPAMTTLNAWIRAWANKFGYQALPFGLSRLELVTAGLVNIFNSSIDPPKEVWCAVSTGTMIRAIQIAWSRSKVFGVAVARNIHDGEIGEANVVSYHRDFYAKADRVPEINTTMTYDAKAYEIFLNSASKGAVFINVGSDAQIESQLGKLKNRTLINSTREWGDLSAFEKK